MAPTLRSVNDAVLMLHPTRQLAALGAAAASAVPAGVRVAAAALAALAAQVARLALRVQTQVSAVLATLVAVGWAVGAALAILVASGSLRASGSLETSSLQASAERGLVQTAVHLATRGAGRSRMDGLATQALAIEPTKDRRRRSQRQPRAAKLAKRCTCNQLPTPLPGIKNMLR
eukprot:2689499-Pyramimonas_sp.AAC.2